MATNISTWRTEVAYYVKGPENTLVDWAVLEALRDFCHHTGIWRYTATRISIVKDTAEYTFTDVDTDGKNELDALLWAKYKQNGQTDDQFVDLDIMEFENEELRRRAAWEFEESTTPFGIMVTDEKKLRLYPIPTVASTSGLYFKVQVKPATDATKVPDRIYNDYHKGITHGAVSILQNMTNKAWSSKEHAKDNWNQYTKVRENCKADIQYGRAARVLRVKPRFWCGSRSNSTLRRF
jgi:hypothetical protein